MKSLMMMTAALLLAGAATTAAAQAPDGQALYATHCKRCHGVRGIPPKTMKQKFDKLPVFDAAFFAHRGDDSVVTILTKGKGENMKSFKAKLTPAEMAAVATYLHELVKPAGAGGGR